MSDEQFNALIEKLDNVVMTLSIVIWTAAIAIVIALICIK